MKARIMHLLVTEANSSVSIYTMDISALPRHWLYRLNAHKHPVSTNIYNATHLKVMHR